jgi:acyl-coenzyme A synthetase/AMP-(fatty) acid ligase
VSSGGNVISPIFHHARTQPDAVALVEGERSITYRELAGLIARTATQLGTLGVSSGDRVGLCLKDSAGHLIALLAATRIGAVPVSLDWRATAPENERFVRGLGLKRVLAEPGARLIDGCPAVVLDRAWDRAVALAEPGSAQPGDWNRPFVISASSGSTGAPKFTQMTHLQYHFAIAGRFDVMSLAGRHRYLCTLPLYFGAGRNSCLAHLLRGDCVILYSNLFTAAEYIDVAQRHQATVGIMVPSAVRKLLAASGDEPLLPGMSAFFCTGAPLLAEEKRQAVHRLTSAFHEYYGTAETLVISVLRPGDFADRAESVGQPHSFAETEIVNEDGRVLPIGAVGRLRYRSPGLGMPVAGDAVESSFGDGWFYPGEVARLDELGYIFLLGRSTDVIMRSGAKIFPAEIEAVLHEHPAIAEAAVVGHAPPGLEEEVVAFFVASRSLPLGEIIAHCRASLTPHKVPRQFREIPRFPRLTSGKIDKAALTRILGGEPQG